MLERYHRQIETLANIGIVIVAVLGGLVLVRQLAAPSPTVQAADVRRPPSNPQPASTGSRLSLPGVDWNAGEQTLVFVLSTTCKFCTHSAPFYSRVVQAAHANGRTRLVAVFPQPGSEAKRYLTEAGVVIDDVLQAPPAAVGSRGTPTLLLVDKTGTVKRVWIGQLPSERESEVLAAL